MSLIRLSLGLVMLASFRMTTLPPASPDNTERTATEWPELLARSKLFSLWMQAPTSLGIIEALVITANTLPPTPLIQAIMRCLAPASTAAAIRITPPFLLAFALITSGTALRLWCFRLLGPMFTFELSLRRGHHLVTRGPYAVVRHPGYAGYALLVAGMISWYAGRGSWVAEAGLLRTAAGKGVLGAVCTMMVVSLSGILSRMRREDALLRKRFGKEWEEWAEKVPWMLIPGVV